MATASTAAGAADGLPSERSRASTAELVCFIARAAACRAESGRMDATTGQSDVWRVWIMMLGRGMVGAGNGGGKADKGGRRKKTESRSS
jgi:hypothetical protein